MGSRMQEEELDLVIDLSQRLGVRPVIGIRAKLRTRHSGHYGSISGEKGKFGLTTTQILSVVLLGANMQVIDIGGGLKSGDSDISVAYGLEEYAAAVVTSVRYVCDRKVVKHSVLCNESGRAIVSHHSILIFEAISSGASFASVMDGLALPVLGFRVFFFFFGRDAGTSVKSLACNGSYCTRGIHLGKK
ncbi:hypothetical protein SLEP1_g54295 [Rubroshorea leprosula]|uniref:Arginine decarboxylase n=1 Tax=Rubroshorea leprosula TaxID=152421 RepID=A0AAV5MEV1_9ROSI|nr:hypothetical protein SLEP1_g54295 [Rubroshorea leprosula]